MPEKENGVVLPSPKSDGVLKISGKLLVSWWCCLSLRSREERVKILRLLIYNCFIRRKKNLKQMGNQNLI